jgi:hypothetical protein
MKSMKRQAGQPGDVIGVTRAPAHPYTHTR